MQQTPEIEDDRGVDIAQIRRQLRLGAAERVQTMVEAANTLVAIRDHARSSVRPTD